MIKPLLGAAATTAAAHGLRRVAADIRRDLTMWLMACVAMVLGGLCLTGAAFFFLSERLSPAEAMGILGAVYLLAAGAFFLARRRTT